MPFYLSGFIGHSNRSVADSRLKTISSFSGDRFTLLVGSCLLIVVAKLDVLLVHHLLGAHAVSAFFPAVVITGLLMILSDAITIHLKPLLLEANSSTNAAISPDAAPNTSSDTNNRIIGSLRVFLCSNSLIILLLLVSAKPLLRLYGETQLTLGSEVLRVMLVAQLLLPLRAILSSLIKFTGNPLHNLYVLLFATTLTVLLALYLQTDYQFLGVAIVFSLGFVLGAVLRTGIVVVHLHRPIDTLFGIQTEVAITTTEEPSR